MTNDRAQAKSPLKHWHEILEEWVFQVRKISRITDKMSRSTGEEFTPYAYGEQTNVGVLASAATRVGWAALQERRVKKQANDGIRDSYLGRADLLLCNGVLFDRVEAKLTRCPLSSPALKRVVSKHKKAVVDSEKLSSSFTEKGNLISLLFIVPYIYRETEVDYSDKISPFLDRLINEFRPTIFASVFPKKVEIVGSDDKDGVGIIVIGHSY